MATALGAICRVPPRTQQSGAVGIEKHYEVLTLPVNLESEVGPPLCGHLTRPVPEALQDPFKAHPLRVEEPGAVTRLEDDRVHETIVANDPVRQP